MSETTRRQFLIGAACAATAAITPALATGDGVALTSIANPALKPSDIGQWVSGIWYHKPLVPHLVESHDHQHWDWYGLPNGTDPSDIVAREVPKHTPHDAVNRQLSPPIRHQHWSNAGSSASNNTASRVISQ